MKKRGKYHKLGTICLSSVQYVSLQTVFGLSVAMADLGVVVNQLIA